MKENNIYVDVEKNRKGNKNIIFLVIGILAVLLLPILIIFMLNYKVEEKPNKISNIISKIIDHDDDEKHHVDNLAKFVWPEKGLAMLIPNPKSTYGKIVMDNPYKTEIIVGNISYDEYKNYVKECENKGFVFDVDKDLNEFDAKNNNAYELEVDYIANNTIKIVIEHPHN